MFDIYIYLDLIIILGSYVPLMYIGILTMNLMVSSCKHIEKKNYVTV